METIHVLAIVDGLDDLLLIDMFRQGQLYDETIDIVVLVQLIYTCQEFCFCDISLETDERALEATGLTGQYLILHIRFRSSVMAHQYGSQMGLLATLSNNLLNLFGNLSLDGRCRCFTVN